jgi:outer membrane protein assembly factor BamA
MSFSYTHKIAVILLLTFAINLVPLFTQEGGITVTDLSFIVKDGNTREKALRRWVQVKEGKTFGSEEDLKSMIDRDVQELVNLRMFLSVSARILPDPAESVSGRKVEFTIVDANTFIPIPLPLYDSNTGGIQLLYVQIWDNMFGSLTNWFSLATLTLRKDDNGKIETGPWLFAPQVSNIKAGSFVSGVRFGQERVESKTYNGSSLATDYRYDRSALYFDTEFRFGEQRRLYYTIEPGVELRYGYTDYLSTGGFSETPFGTQLFQSFYYDSVDFF